MTNESKPLSPPNGNPVDSGISQPTAPKLDRDLDEGRRKFSASALAAAVAALALPLVRVGSVEAQTLLQCHGEGILGVDIGDLPELRGSCFEALPSDCRTIDSAGTRHYRDADEPRRTDRGGDRGRGDGGGCGVDCYSDTDYGG